MARTAAWDAVEAMARKNRLACSVPTGRFGVAIQVCLLSGDDGDPLAVASCPLVANFAICGRE